MSTTKAKSWPKDTFKTAQAWVRATLPDVEGIDADRYADAIARICKKRQGVWTVLKAAPLQDIERALIWHAFKNATHAVQWGNLASWKDGTTILLMRADDKARELHEFVFDATLALAKARRA
jgi:hypothetical protein